MDKDLGDLGVDLDGRFKKIRTSETNLGNWIMDIVREDTKADFAVLNSGTMRSDKVREAEEALF